MSSFRCFFKALVQILAPVSSLTLFDTPLQHCPVALKNSTASKSSPTCSESWAAAPSRSYHTPKYATVFHAFSVQLCRKLTPGATGQKKHTEAILHAVSSISLPRLPERCGTSISGALCSEHHHFQVFLTRGAQRLNTSNTCSLNVIDLFQNSKELAARFITVWDQMIYLLCVC